VHVLQTPYDLINAGEEKKLITDSMELFIDLILHNQNVKK